MPKGIDDILSGKENPAEETPKVEPKVESAKPESDPPPDKPAEKAKDEGPEQAPPEDGGVSDSGPDVTRQIAGLKAASTAERKKRQEVEQALEQARKEAAERDQWYRQQQDNWQRQLQQFAPKPPEQPKVNLFEDPENWTQQTIQQPMQSLETKLRMEFSEKLARKTYGNEYGEAEKWAQSQIGQNPMHPLRHLLMYSDDPGETLVQEYKKHKLASEMADPAAYRQKILDEMLSDPEQKRVIIERLGAEPLKTAQPSQPTAPTNLPSNLAGTRSVGGAKGPAWQGPRPLAEIINRGK